ncbi:hypothetical protein AB1Y20_001855 [Prymnesium parvum]|uniref:JmjC domain-containing protein n=1 Tax=Prymnesium parvum TaxID=97485 RepID=A0AB34J7F8_PRYPA
MDFSIFDAPASPHTAPPRLTTAEPDADPESSTRSPTAHGCTGPPDIPEPPPFKRPRAAASVLPLARCFVQKHCAQTCADLRANDAASVEADLALAASFLRQDPPNHSQCRVFAERIETSTWEALLTKGWPHVCWREAYVLAQLMLCCMDTEAQDEEKALQRCDRAFILGGPCTEVCDCIALLEPAVSPPVLNGRPTDCVREDLPPAVTALRPSHPIERRRMPTHLSELRAIHTRGAAVLLEGGMDGWQAPSRWKDFHWLRAAYGHRLVPVELGRLQVGEGSGAASRGRWAERIMHLDEFVDTFLLREHLAEGEGRHAEIGYLAQHALFEQLRQLQHDFSIPTICSLGKLKHVNAWLGPGGTVTPCHFDSYDNIFAQVVGYKYVRLFEVNQSDFMYGIKEAATGLEAQGNLSAVDVENPDLKAHPLFANAKYTDAILSPGDMLYVPAGVWHYVRSLTSSFSISFWF